MENLSKKTILEDTDYETEPRLYIDGNADRGGDHRCAGGIAIPVFNGSLHKAKVAADMANVRVYYAELQTQYITTGEYIDIGDDLHQNARRDITFLDGTTVQMQAGTVSAILARDRGTNEPVGYQVYYMCDKYDHELLLE